MDEEETRQDDKPDFQILESEYVNHREKKLAWKSVMTRQDSQFT